MASPIRIQGRAPASPSTEAKGTPRPPQTLFARLLETRPGPAHDELLAALEKQLPDNKRGVEDALQQFDTAARTKLLGACSTAATPKLAQLFTPVVRAVNDAEFRRRVAGREKLISAHESGKVLSKSLERLDIIADKAVAAFDPLTGDVLVDVDRLKGNDVDAVLEHELAHRRLHQLTPDQRNTIVKAFTSSPLWPKLRDGVEASDPAVVNMSPSRLVDELLAIVIGQPKHPLTALAKPILESKALEPMRGAQASKPYVANTRELEFDGWVETDGPDPSANWSRLNDTQKKALRDAETGAVTQSAAKHQALVQRLQKLGFSEVDLTHALEFLSTKAQVTVNFQPDKQTQGGKPLIDAFIAENDYRNQFETKISGGSLAPTAGSQRDTWERTIFRGDYHDHPLIPAERPKYGSLNAEENAAGGATHYGNSYLVLKDGVKNRLTMTPYDSSQMQADAVGTCSHIENVLSDPRLPDGKLQAIMARALGRPVPPGNWANNYVEVQVHGPLDFKTDTAAVVANQMYKGNATYEPKLREFAKKLGVPLEWTNGTSVFDDNSVPVNFAFNAIGNVQAPAAPKDYTVVHYGDAVAYVPTVATAAKPDPIPRGFIAVTHPTAGLVLVPERFAEEGKLSEKVPFGEVATGQPAAVVPMGKRYTVPGAPGIAAQAIDAPAPPAGYTAVGITLGMQSGLAFMPTAADTAVPEAPFGFVAVKHAKAGTLFLPKAFVTDDKIEGVVFGAQLSGLPAPGVSLAPPPPATYTLQHPFGPAYGATNVWAPPAPPDYTAVRYGDTVAYVPSKLGAALPETPPAGCIAWKHPELGITYIPAKYMTGGKRSPEVGFGVTANGLAAPAVPLAASYAFTTVGYPMEAPVAPPGYTVLRLGNSLAFAPATMDAKVPDEAPGGYVAVQDPEAGTVFVPYAMASGGVIAAGNVYGETAKGMPAPAVALAPPTPISISVPNPAGKAYGALALTVPPAPPGYTILSYANNQVAYVATSAGTAVPKKPPNGYIAATHPEAGVVFVPQGYAPDGVLNAAYAFGPTATGFPAPVVDIAPPLPVQVQVPHPSGARYGMMTINVPPAPEGYTMLTFQNTVAYVPASATATAPKKPPFGYTAVTDPEAGTIYVPDACAPGGVLTPGMAFGGPVTGYPAPVVSLAPPANVTVSMPNPAGPAYGPLSLSVPPAPAGFTIVNYANNTVAYVPTSTSAVEPKRPPFGFVAVKHPEAGTIYVPSPYASDGLLNPGYQFGPTATGYPEPVVKVAPPLPILVTVPNPAGPAYGALKLTVPPAPDGYTIISYANNQVAYVPTSTSAAEPKTPPVGYVAAKHPEAGTIYVPAAYAPGGVLNPAYAFGPTATGFAEPVVKLAPPLPVVVQVPNPSGVRYGMVSLTVPPAPDGYTIIALANNVAYVPTTATAAEPKTPPAGYVAVKDPEAGTIYVPAGFAPGGVLNPGYAFGATATGYAAPVVPMAPPAPVMLSVPNPGGPAYGALNISALPPPAGYTPVWYANNTIAYIPTAKDTAVPKKTPFGYTAVTHPEAGTIFVPTNYATGGVLNPAYAFGPTATGYAAPVVAVAPPLPIVVKVPNPSGPTFPVLTLSVPPAPDGYTIISYANNQVAYVPTSAGAAEPAKPPNGYVAAKHPEAGTLYVPAAYAPGGVLNPANQFGPTATGFPEPAVKLAPPLPILVQLPHPSGPRYGMVSVPVPPAPDGYTIVRYANSVAYVPAVAGAAEPKTPPAGYVAAKHPEAGTVFVPNGYAPGGVLNPGYAFGATATGYAAPIVPVAPPTLVQMNFGGRLANAYPPPAGFTVAFYGNGVAAYVRARADAPTPRASELPGYSAVNDPTLGLMYVPSNYAPGGTRLPGYLFGVIAAGQPAAFMDVSGK